VQVSRIGRAYGHINKNGDITQMAKLGSKEKPIIVRVASDAQGKYVAQQCVEHGWHYIIGLEPGIPEDITDLEKALHPPEPFHSVKIGRNEPCPCGSGRKYKKCCAETGAEEG
jgi:SWIM/SEC-C metal-binding protein